MSGPGVLVNTAGTGTRARVTQGRRSISWALGHEDDSPGTATRHCGPTGTRPILPGLLVDTAGSRTGAKVTGDSCLTPRDLAQGPEHELAGTGGRTC